MQQIKRLRKKDFPDEEVHNGDHDEDVDGDEDGDEDEEERLDLVFHALGDRTRRALLKRLANGPAMVTDLAKPFAMSLPAVSKHLKVLEGAGLIVRAIDGRVHTCSLGTAPLVEVELWLSHQRSFWTGVLDSLERYVEAETNVAHGGSTQNQALANANPKRSKRSP